MLVVSYFFTNLSTPISGEQAIIKFVDGVRVTLSSPPTLPPDSIVLINVDCDKKLSYTNQGLERITDRGKLVKLLSALKARNQYKYILMDVFFEEGIVTEHDSLLFNLISSTPRLVIPRHEKAVLADSALYSKAYYADYVPNFMESDFVKYPFMKADGSLTIPMKMYEDVTGNRIKKVGPIFFDKDHLVRRSMTLPFEFTANRKYDENGNHTWLYLGFDLLDDSIPDLQSTGLNLLEFAPEVLDGKYILIGSFEGDDIHNTYMGNISGTTINMNAFLCLMAGHHKASYSFMVILYLIFWGMSYLTLSRHSLRQQLELRLQSLNGGRGRRMLKVAVMCSSWLGYSTFLTITCVVFYFIFGEVHDILVTSTVFSSINVLLTFWSSKRVAPIKEFSKRQYSIIFIKVKDWTHNIDTLFKTEETCE